MHNKYIRVFDPTCVPRNMSAQTLLITTNTLLCLSIKH